MINYPFSQRDKSSEQDLALSRKSINTNIQGELSAYATNSCEEKSGHKSKTLRNV